MNNYGKTIYQKTHAHLLAPGATFVFSPTDPLRCTILKIDEKITYVRDEDEEEHQIPTNESLNITVYLVVDQQLRTKRLRFRKSLTPLSAQIFTYLLRTKVSGLIGHALQAFFSNPQEEGFDAIVMTLAQQAQRNQPTAENMLGTTLTSLLCRVKL